MSIAPIITAVELTLRPTEAMMMEKARIHTFGPLKETLLRIDLVALSVSIWSEIFAMVRISDFIAFQIFGIKTI